MRSCRSRLEVNEPGCDSYQTWNLQKLIYIQQKRFFHLVGENAEKTILTFDLNANIVGPVENRSERFGLHQP
jgi:hypothetical protein